MESWILRVSCKVNVKPEYFSKEGKESLKGFTFTLQETQSIHDSMNIPKLEFIALFTFYYKYLKYKNYFKFRN